MNFLWESSWPCFHTAVLHVLRKDWCMMCLLHLCPAPWKWCVQHWSAPSHTSPLMHSTGNLHLVERLTSNVLWTIQDGGCIEWHSTSLSCSMKEASVWREVLPVCLRINLNVQKGSLRTEGCRVSMAKMLSAMGLGREKSAFWGWLNPVVIRVLYTSIREEWREIDSSRFMGELVIQQNHFHSVHHPHCRPTLELDINHISTQLLVLCPFWTVKKCLLIPTEMECSVFFKLQSIIPICQIEITNAPYLCIHFGEIIFDYVELWVSESVRVQQSLFLAN